MRPSRANRRYVSQASTLLLLLAPLISFAQNPEILINAQGLAQEDLSIRGSSYTGAGVSLNGLNLKVPYSAHFNSELPIPAYLLSAPDVRTGLNNVSGHLIGTAAYATAPQETRLQASSSIGTKEHYQNSLSAQTDEVGAFLEWEKARQIDHGNNDLDRILAGGFAQTMVNDWQLDLIGSYQEKEFGAQGYYGIPSNLYAKDRTKDTLIFAGATRGDLDDSFLRASTTWRQFDDRYEIPSSNYVNDVQSGFGAFTVEGRTMEIQNIALNLRGDIEHERVGGDIGHHDRTRGSILIMPEARFERFTFKAGLNSVFLSDESAKWLPQAGVDWFATDNGTVYAAYSETVQQPDYQLLYADGPYHAGNDDLNLQRAKKVELGFRQFLSEHLDWRVAAFYRHLKNASDWVKDTESDTAWTATDLGSLDSTGVESELNFYPSDALELNLFYQWVHKDDYDYYAGLYELDYPEHLLSFAGNWKFAPAFELFAAQTLRYQSNNQARSGSDFGADASVGLHWFPRFANNARLSFQLNNLWDTDFQDVPGLKPPGRTVSSGITVTW